MFRRYDDKWTTPCKHHLPGIWWALDKCKQLLPFSSFKPILCFLYGSQPYQWAKGWDLRRMEEALTSSLSWEGKRVHSVHEREAVEPRQALAFMIHTGGEKKRRAPAPIAYTWLLLTTLAPFLLRVLWCRGKGALTLESGSPVLPWLIPVWSRVEAYSITLIWQTVVLVVTCPRSQGLLTSMTIFSYQSMVSFPSPLMYSSITVDWACGHLLALFYD